MSGSSRNPKSQNPNPNSQNQNLNSQNPTSRSQDSSLDAGNPNVLARIADNPQLARAVPLLRPEVLHAVITHCGLQDSGELLALATPEQLSAVFDLDLWKASRAGADEQFDAARFCEWLEVLIDTNAKSAAASLASMDPALVVAGLSPHIRVFDPGVFAPVSELSGADAVMNAGRELGVHTEIGGYVIVARRPDAWDTIVETLFAFEEHDAGAFHRVMRACRRLSDAGREIDSLDDLLPDAHQASFDLSAAREQRQDRLGFLPPQQARAFLEASRHVSFTEAPPECPPVFVAYQRSLEMANEPEARTVPPAGEQSENAQADEAPAVAAVIDVLRGAGVLTDTPRALLTGATEAESLGKSAFNRYLERCGESADRWMLVQQQLAFLANALVAGCSVQGRTFARGEAIDAAAATCNLGLEHWPRHWGESSEYELLAVFQVGWTRLHVDASTVTAMRLLDVLDQLRFNDLDLQLEVQALRRELHRMLEAGTPWRVRDRLEVLASLDLPAWAAVSALLGECPVLLANVSTSGLRPLHTVNPSEFQFISNAADISAIQRFLQSLTDLLTR